MRIKSLDISGFKSFAARARLQFGDGITGVVGPNGCGKSNVVDAIRWVLGEMSAKHLRGRGMQDVIFAGADGKAAQNMAEVTLTFDNDGDAPEQYAGVSEIAVTRRLFRDGTSEYLLNKQAVRLRDVVDLFLGTGVGTRAYSIIEQGRIGFIVSARPEERRQVIEEVAGISKFKSRKKAALRRMAATEQNLARVRDVLTELDRQLSTLRGQAERARVYRARKAALYALELHRASYQWLTLRLLLGHQAERASLAEQALVGIDEQVGAQEAQCEAEQGALSEAERRVAELQRTAMAAHAAFVATERDLGHWQEQATQLGAQAARAAEHSEQLASKLVAAQQEQGAQAEASKRASEAHAAAEVQLTELAQALAATSAEVAALDQTLSGLRREALAKVQAAAEQRGRLASLNARVAAADERRTQQAAQTEALTGQVAAAEGALAAQAEQLAEANERQASERERGLALVAEEQRLAADCQRTAASVAQQGHALSQQQHRLTSLGDIVRRLDGYADGVRSLLGAASGHAHRQAQGHKQGKHRGHGGADAAAAITAPSLPGLLGVVAEVLDVPPMHEAAIEAVLGERLQYVRVSERQHAHAAMAKLADGRLGRSGFVPAELTPSAPLPAALGLAEGGVLGIASELVRAQPGAQALCEALLGHVVLVESLAVAEAQAARHAGVHCTWVTPTGELVDAQGLLLGGAQSGAGLLANRREIRQLTASIEAAEAALAAAKAAADAEATALAHVRRQRDEARANGHQLELQVLGLKKGTEAKEHELRRLRRQATELAEQASKTAAEADRAKASLAEAMLAAESLSGESDEERERLGQAERARVAAAETQAKQQAQLTEQRIAHASREERAKGLATAAARLALDIASMEAERSKAASESDAGRTQAAALRAQAEGAGLSLAERRSQSEAAGAAQAVAEQALTEVRAAHQARDQSLRQARRDQAEWRAQLAEHQLRAQKHALDQQNLCAQVAHRHDVDLLAELVHFHDRPGPTKAAHKQEQALARELKEMGAINLTAIDECAQVEHRSSFLRAQQQDLAAALGTLRSAVGRIDQDSRERFAQAFAAVDEMFQKMYPRLFGGGSAKLVLVEGEEGAEAGVDMVAMPPGKKLQNVSLLSGGEKALTATALVFAIFLIKPSPFCILDEVDAPLDEANVGRFNDTLRDMSKLSQFIVITHNKQTMLQMDRLFGITMEDAGLSKVVAVDLDDQRPGSQAA